MATAVLSFTLALITIYSLILPSCEARTEYHVRSATVDCPAESTNCFTLNDYARDPDQYFTENSSFILLEGEHHLNTSLRLVNAVNISLMGMNNSTVIMLSGACITFNNSEKIVLKLLQIEQRESSANITESLQIVDTSMAQLVDVIFTSNEGGAIAIINCQNVSFFDRNVFANNTATSGGAIYASNSSITLSGDNTFVNNTATSGGAIYASNSSITLSGDNTFVNNTATSGGAIYASNSSITLSGDSTFVNNTAGTDYFVGDYTKGGGAIFASQSKIEFAGFSRFEGNGAITNAALLGGAIMTVQNSMLNIWNDSLITNNKAHSGGALFSVDSSINFSGSIEISSNLANGSHGGGIFSYNSHITFRENINLTSNNATRKGGGIYLERSTFNCQNNVTFFKNMAISSRNLLMGGENVPDYSEKGVFQAEGGGVYCTLNSNISLSGVINFERNMADTGGGMFIPEGITWLMLQAPVDIIFYSNVASDRGGAVYFYDSNSLYSTLCQNVSVERRNCVFEVSDSTTDLLYENIHINFTANDAYNAGSVLFGGDLEFCKLQVNNVQTNITGYQFLQNVSTTFNVISSEQNVSNVSYVTSLPLQACFCINRHPNCTMRDYPIYIEKGKTFNISLITMGQLSMPVPSRIISYILDRHNSTKLYRQSYDTYQTNGCRNLGFTIRTNISSERLFLYPEGCAADNGTLTVVVNFINCSAGFVLVDGDHCECVEELQKLGAICDIDRGLIRRGRGENSSVWMKPILSETGNYSGLIWYKKCPSSYCTKENDSNPVWLNFSTDYSDGQCLPNRTGLLCGNCTEGYSLVLSSLECKKCTNSYLGLLVFFAVAGIALIAILFALHMTVATGTINGLILYANVVNICRGEFFTLDISPDVLSIFIAWINLDFGIPSCFFDGLNAYSYNWLQFAFPFYLWFLIGLIILAHKFSSRVGRLFGSNPVAVLATIILMSYTKLLETTVGVLSFRELQYCLDGPRKVWKYDPSTPYFKGKHAVLAGFSIFVIVFLLIPYILLLLFGYCLLSYSGRRGFNWMNKFKPFLDAYYAPFSKKARYWTGFLLLVRVGLFLSLISNPLSSNNTNLILKSSLFIGVAIIPWLSQQNVYEKAYVNILESSFVLNICILMNVTYHIQAGNGKQPFVTYISVGIAFLEFVGIVIFHLYCRVKTSRMKTLFKPNNTSSHRILNNEEKAVSSTLVDIREPLLEDVL